MQVILGRHLGRGTNKWKPQNAAEREGTKKGNQDFLLWENQRNCRQNFGYTFLKE
jgi:DNA primase